MMEIVQVNKLTRWHGVTFGRGSRC